ncbi:MAG: NUDIX hydrolase [Planctomycetota bacterium]
MKIVRKETVRKGKKFDIAVHTLQSKTGEQFEREFIDHPGAVVLVPLLDDGRVVLIRNYRHSIDQFLVEVPAGTANLGEPFEETAIRELAEETGYRAGKIERLMQFYPCPGASGERMVVYLCTQLQPGDPRREVDEEMEVEVVPLQEALAMIDDGRIIDGKTIIGLWSLVRHLAADNG